MIALQKGVVQPLAQEVTVLSTISLPGVILQKIFTSSQNFSLQTLHVCSGRCSVCVWVGGCFVFTNRAAGIFATMTTNHMTRCIRLPWTVCSEAWCEHSLCCSAPFKVLSLSYLSFLCPPSHFVFIQHSFTERQTDRLHTVTHIYTWKLPNYSTVFAAVLVATCSRAP